MRTMQDHYTGEMKETIDALVQHQQDWRQQVEDLRRREHDATVKLLHAEWGLVNALNLKFPKYCQALHFGSSGYAYMYVIASVAGASTGADGKIILTLNVSKSSEHDVQPNSYYKLQMSLTDFLNLTLIKDDTRSSTGVQQRDV